MKYEEERLDWRYCTMLVGIFLVFWFLKSCGNWEYRGDVGGDVEPMGYEIEAEQ